MDMHDWETYSWPDTTALGGVALLEMDLPSVDWKQRIGAQRLQTARTSRDAPQGVKHFERSVMQGLQSVSTQEGS